MFSGGGDGDDSGGGDGDEWYKSEGARLLCARPVLHAGQKRPPSNSTSSCPTQGGE